MDSGEAEGVKAGFEPGREVRGEWVDFEQTRVSLAGQVVGSAVHLCSGCIRRPRGGQGKEPAPQLLGRWARMILLEKG